MYLATTSITHDQAIAAGVFDGNQDKGHKGEEALIARLYQQINQLKVERDFLAERSGP